MKRRRHRLSMRDRLRYRRRLVEIGLKAKMSGPMAQPTGLRGRRYVKEWTAADDERLRELLVEGMSAREIGIELNCTAVAVRSRAFPLNLLERKPVVSQIGI